GAGRVQPGKVRRAARVDIENGRVARADAVLDRGADPRPERVGENARNDNQVEVFRARPRSFQEALRRQRPEVLGEVVGGSEAPLAHASVKGAVLANEV